MTTKEFCFKLIFVLALVSFFGCQKKSNDKTFSAQITINEANDFINQHKAKLKGMAEDLRAVVDVEKDRLDELGLVSTLVDSNSNVFFILDYNLWSFTGIMQKTENRESLGDDVDRRITQFTKIKNGWFLFTLCEDD